ncbi:8727_t:CDS:2 [Dentiscutata erythropus]|uniref:8727_t:CDS:1 n=1 Tax=Dentiscutata erythropus TaxID=1348616 RepID=A0A9N9JWF8_9GLOM|nr:8727_t:CDS:2 [Dentiscutata erythropus]
MANCFIQLVRLIAIISYMPKERDTIAFQNQCIEIINNHWNELEAEPYILQSMGYKDKLFVQTLIVQIIKFKEKEFLYKVRYDSQNENDISKDYEDKNNRELDDDLEIPNHQVVVLVINNIVDLHHQAFNQVEDLYISNKDNINSDITINEDYEFNLEELVQDLE